MFLFFTVCVVVSYTVSLCSELSDSFGSSGSLYSFDSLDSLDPLDSSSSLDPFGSSSSLDLFGSSSSLDSSDLLDLESCIAHSRAVLNLIIFFFLQKFNLYAVNKKIVTGTINKNIPIM